MARSAASIDTPDLLTEQIPLQPDHNENMPYLNLDCFARTIKGIVTQKVLGSWKA